MGQGRGNEDDSRQLTLPDPPERTLGGLTHSFMKRQYSNKASCCGVSFSSSPFPPLSIYFVSETRSVVAQSVLELTMWVNMTLNL